MHESTPHRCTCSPQVVMNITAQPGMSPEKLAAKVAADVDSHVNYLRATGHLEGWFARLCRRLFG
jgi:hypothetical protein